MLSAEGAGQVTACSVLGARGEGAKRDLRQTQDLEQVFTGLIYISFQTVFVISTSILGFVNCFLHSQGHPECLFL